MSQLDEFNDPILEEGQDAHVIAKRIEVKVGVGSLLFEILLWVLFIVPGVIFLVKKIKAKNYFQQLEQSINTAASTIDIKLEERVVILKNLAQLVDKAIQLDKETYTLIAKYRSGIDPDNGDLDSVQSEIDNMFQKINFSIEKYPELQAHNEISQAIQQNRILQGEISAARHQYNDLVNRWNRDIFSWPTKQIVAAKQGYHTRIPFAAASDIRRQANETFF